MGLGAVIIPILTQHFNMMFEILFTRVWQEPENLLFWSGLAKRLQWYLKIKIPAKGKPIRKSFYNLTLVLWIHNIIRRLSGFDLGTIQYTLSSECGFARGNLQWRGVLDLFCEPKISCFKFWWIYKYNLHTEIRAAWIVYLQNFKPKNCWI